MNNLRLSLRVFFSRITIIGCLLVTAAVFGQDPEGPRRRSTVIDDSTKQIYGPKTSQYFFEEDFFRNRAVYRPIDTLIRDFHRYSYVQRNNNYYQDLGNIGTAIRPIFVETPSIIGVTSGFDAYELYWKSEKVRYFDTKSPYSNMKVILGGKGRSITNVVYSRNINPRWNFGFDYRGLFVDKQIQRSSKGDRHVKSNYYDFFTSYKSKDSTYALFFNYRRNFQEADEYGGIKLEDEFNYSDLFLVNAQPQLTEAESNDLRSNIHLFQQYRIGSALQLYHIADFYRQRNQFNDNTDATTADAYYDFVEVDSAQARDEVTFKSIRNEVGIKGNLLKLFYNGYAALRGFTMDYKFFNEDGFYLDTKGEELYIGGRMELALDSLVDVRGWVEWLVENRYRVEGSINTKWFTASISRVVSTPTFLQQAYRGSHDVWLKNFFNTEYNVIKGNLIYRSGRLSVYPGLSFTTLRNYVFFKNDDSAISQTVLPVQSDGYQTFVSPSLSFRINFLRHTSFTTNVIYTKMLENADDAVQLPEIFVNSQLAYSNIWFNGNFDFQVGVDLHYKSKYFAPGYDLPIQQYYTQLNIQTPAFPAMDVFLNAKIKRGRIFIKYHNLLKAFSDYGYVPTPYYPGQKNVVDFGFDWSFYD